MFDLFDRLRQRIRESKLPPVQDTIKRNNPTSFDLSPSTWSTEVQWWKFLVLNDGSVIPVVSSHMETIAGDDLKGPNVGYILTEYDDTGGVRGSVDPEVGEMNVGYTSHLTADQLASLRKLWVKYNCVSLAADSSHGAFLTPIDSADRFIAVLKYGKEMAEAPTERIQYDLHDRLLHLHEADRSTLPLSQQEILNDVGESEDLDHSISRYDSEWRKFLILNDGSIIPVKGDHSDVIMKYDTISNFNQDGGLQCRLVDGGELAVFATRVKNEDQIQSLKRMFIKYGCNELVMRHEALPIDTADRLEAVLRYGKEMAVAPVDEGMKEIEDELMSRLPDGSNLDFDLSTDDWEAEWMKFLILTDGKILKVLDNHGSALTNDQCYGQSAEFNHGGGIQGRYSPSDKELSIYSPRVDRFTAEQLESIRKIASKYDVRKLTVEIRSDHFSVPVKSVDQIIGAIEYGKEMVEAPVEEGIKYGRLGHLNESDVLSPIQKKVLDWARKEGLIYDPTSGEDPLDDAPKVWILNDGTIVLGDDHDDIAEALGRVVMATGYSPTVREFSKSGAIRVVCSTPVFVERGGRRATSSQVDSLWNILELKSYSSAEIDFGSKELYSFDSTFDDKDDLRKLLS